MFKIEGEGVSLASQLVDNSNETLELIDKSYAMFDSNEQVIKTNTKKSEEDLTKHEALLEGIESD